MQKVSIFPLNGFVQRAFVGRVCGYVLGALDTKAFYKRVEAEWYPKMRELYATPPSLQHRDSWSNAESIIGNEERQMSYICDLSDKSDYLINILDEFHNPRFFYPEALSMAFRSHLHIDLIQKAQGFGLGMIVFPFPPFQHRYSAIFVVDSHNIDTQGSAMLQRLMDALKEKGSKGVFLGSLINLCCSSTEH